MHRLLAAVAALVVEPLDVQLGGCNSQAPEHQLSSHGSWAYLPCGMWNLPGPGIEPMSLALAGRFLTSGPPGKSKTVNI